MFQAWEIILQSSDIGGWMDWMAMSQKVGVAPGWQVSNMRSRCKAGGLGQTCVVAENGKAVVLPARPPFTSRG